MMQIKINFHIIRNVFKIMQMNLKDQEVEAIFFQFDRDKNGFIDYEELINIIYDDVKNLKKQV